LFKIKLCFLESAPSVSSLVSSFESSSMMSFY
jgi:hypothetical protein